MTLASDVDLYDGRLCWTEDGYLSRCWSDVSKAFADIGRYRRRLARRDEKVAGKSKAHPGFAGAEKQIMAKEGLSKASAGAILGKTSRDASAAAKRRNPRLNRVKGASKGKR